MGRTDGHNTVTEVQVGQDLLLYKRDLDVILKVIVIEVLFHI